MGKEGRPYRDCLFGDSRLNEFRNDTAFPASFLRVWLRLLLHIRNLIKSLSNQDVCSGPLWPLFYAIVINETEVFKLVYLAYVHVDILIAKILLHGKKNSAWSNIVGNNKSNRGSMLITHFLLLSVINISTSSLGSYFLNTLYIAVIHLTLSPRIFNSLYSI